MYNLYYYVNTNKNNFCHKHHNSQYINCRLGQFWHLLRKKKQIQFIFNKIKYYYKQQFQTKLL